MENKFPHSFRSASVNGTVRSTAPFENPKRESHLTGSTHGSAHESIACSLSGNTGSTPVTLKTFQPHRCGLISITVIVCDFFKFNKRRQLFIGVHNETLSVAANAREQSRLFARRNPEPT
jgi:hypothetical protein